MESLYLLIPLSVIGVGVAIWFFLKMNSSGQFDDDEGPAFSVLLDNDRAVPTESDNKIESRDE